jgi:hypothetical protein
MSYKSEQIDKYFRDQLGGFELNPPQGNWDSIVRKLGNRKKKRMAAVIFRIAAGMAILVSTGIGIYLFSQPEKGTVSNAISAIHEVMPESEISATKNTNQTGEKERATNAYPETGNLNKKNAVAPSNPGPVVTRNEQVPMATSDQHNINHAGDASENEVGGNTVIGILYRNPLPTSLLTNNINHTLEFPVYSSNAVYAGEELLFAYLDEYPQDPEAKKVKKNYWSLGSEIAPLYSYRHISSDDLQSDMMDNLNENENGILAYAGGIRLAFSTGKRLTVQSGVYYSRYGQEKNQVQSGQNKYASYNNDYNFISVTNSTGTISGGLDDRANADLISSDFEVVQGLNEKYGLVNTNVFALSESVEENTTLNQYFDYVELPLIVKYKIIDRKMDFSMSGGLVTNILIGSPVHLVQDGNTTRTAETYDISQINYLASIGLGFEYPVASRIGLTIEPRFRYYINPIDQSSRINVRPYSFGFFAGFNYKF